MAPRSNISKYEIIHAINFYFNTFFRSYMVKNQLHLILWATLPLWGYLKDWDWQNHQSHLTINLRVKLLPTFWLAFETIRTNIKIQPSFLNSPASASHIYSGEAPLQSTAKCSSHCTWALALVGPTRQSLQLTAEDLISYIHRINPHFQVTTLLERCV
jgi:hypothetical protein